MPLYFYWFRCVMRFWNSLLTTNSTLLREIGRADLRLANKKCSWSYQVLTAINELSNAQQFTEALHACEKVNMDVFVKVLCDQVINVWRGLDHISPQEAHASSRVMKTYHSHFGIPLGSTQGYWDPQSKSKKPRLPHYLRTKLPSHLSRALSCIRLSGHNLRVETLRHGNRCPYELRICDKLTGMLSKMKSTLCLTVRARTWSKCVYTTSTFLLLYSKILHRGLKSLLTKMMPLVWLLLFSSALIAALELVLPRAHSNSNA